VRNFGAVPGTEFRDDDHVFYFTTTGPESGVMWANLAPEEVATALAEVRAVFQRRGRRALWFVGPDSAPTDLGQRLHDAGMERGHEDKVMAANLDHLPPTPYPVAPEIAIQDITDLSGIEDFNIAEAAGFGAAPEAAAWYASVRRATPFGPGQPVRRYVAYWEGQPATSTSLFFGAGVVGVYDVATDPAFRRRGISTALVRRALEDAQGEGYHVAVLQASDEGFSVYQRLGFNALTPHVMYRDPQQ
jgi:GNAT superfamily N-acetyltransferase